MELRQRLAHLVGASDAREVTGGRQSRVFVARHHDGRMVILKALNAAFIDSDETRSRVATVAELARLDRRVCAPIPIHGQLVIDVDDHDTSVLVSCYEQARGTAPNPADSADAILMGEHLALLHATMQALPSRTLPVVAALRIGSADLGDVQLLHGDFSATNLRHGDDGVRIFDFDDCGYGPALFDVANALYMVDFDGKTTGSQIDFAAFRDAFIAGYGAVAGDVDLFLVTELVDRRVEALRAWLNDLTTAPIGIRTASVEWHQTLRSFVRQHRSQR